MTDYLLPFEFEDPNSHGLKEITGMLRFDGKDLHIEFQSKDSILGVFKGEVEDVVIPMTELVQVEFVKKWLSRKLVFHAQSIRTFEDFPAAEGSTMQIKVKKKDEDKAKSMASTLMLHISEEKLRRLDN